MINDDDTLNQISVLVIVPGTKKLSALRYRHTVQVDPTPLNGLAIRTVFLPFMVQAVDRTWVEEPPIGELEETDLCRVEDAILEALGFNPPNAQGPGPTPPAPAP